MDSPSPIETIRRPAAAESRSRESAWRLTAWMAGIFLLLCGATLAFTHVSVIRDDPLDSTRLKEAKEKLRLSPADEKLKDSIRQIDLQLRQRYFRQLSQKRVGFFLLLGSAAVFLIATSRVARFNNKLPMPQPAPDASEVSARSVAHSRRVVALTGSALGVMLAILALSLASITPRRAQEIDRILGVNQPAAAANEVASEEELRQNWPGFRGADGSGGCNFANLPATWDPKSGAGIAWKVPLPARGFNSPIIWHDHVFFSGTNESGHGVYCLDGRTGRTLWQQKLTTSAPVPGPQDASPSATATMVTDGRRVYAFFGNGDLGAFTIAGAPAWSKNLGPVKNAYGHAASLAMWRDKVILQLDQGEPEQAKSKLYALDGLTGRIAWQTSRKTGSSWATPIVIQAAGKAQVITLAVPSVIAYGATDGTEIWRAEYMNGEITPSPAFAAGMVLAVSPSEKLLALRADGTGNVTKTHVTWSTEENVPDITSPAVTDELIFTLTTSGVLTCFNTKDGKKNWEHDFETQFHSSPAIARDRVYLFGQNGAAWVVEASPRFKEILRAEFPDEFHTSPAFAPNALILKGETNVWCIGTNPDRLANK